MKVVLLCGGIGKRMYPINKDKFLLKFLGKTILERQIELARKVGLNDFVIISNKRSNKKIREICNSIDANFEFAIQEEPKGMADALISAKDLLINHEIIVIKTSDIFEISAYEEILNAYKNTNYDSYILSYEVKKYFPGGYLDVNENNEIKKIIEKPGEGNEPSNLINIVVHLHKKTKDLFEYIEKTKRDRDDVYEFSIYQMIKNGFKFKAVKYTDFWAAITYPHNILKIMNYFLDSINKSQISSKVNIDPSAKIEGKVILEEGVRVLENAIIRGPCYIGKNCIIGNNTLIRNSHIGDNSIIGFSSEVKNSYICNNCWFHTNYIGDSIILDNCSFGSGTVTGNLRFDEENIGNSELNKLGVIMGSNCRTGINSSIMPGIKIGNNSIIGPGVVLYKDLESNKLALLEKNSYVVKENKIILDISKREKLKIN